jgi:hypothetical protein
MGEEETLVRRISPKQVTAYVLWRAARSVLGPSISWTPEIV